MNNNNEELEKDQLAAENEAADSTSGADTVPASETQQQEGPAAGSEEVEKLKQELVSTQDRMYRNQAEFENIKKRYAREAADKDRYRSKNLALALLPAVDSLEKALAVEVDDEKAASLKKGVEMALNLVKDAFQQEGIVEIDALNKPFDPNLHEALMTQPASEGQESGTVLTVFSKGYMIHDMVLKHAQVVVAE